MLQQNLDKFNDYHKRFLNGIPNYIGGQAVVGVGEEIVNLTPTTNQPLQTFKEASLGQVDSAARKAEEAFKIWKSTSGKERKKILHRIADLIESRAEEIALIESMDTGQSIKFMSKAALRGADNYRFYADKATEALDGLSTPAEEHQNYSVRTPLGPVAVITPWNTPFMLSTWKIAPALAAGCTVVHKPAELSPLTATILTEIMIEAGLPEGTVNIIHGRGETVGKVITEHPAIKGVAFVGDTHTGRLIMKQAAPTLKRVHFELGGKNPVIVFSDADLDRALDAAVFMIYSLNGERCTSSSRLLVEKNIYEDFCNRVVERVNKIKVGHPLDPTTEIGPLIDKGHFSKVTGYFDCAREEAKVAVGGKSTQIDNSENGNYVLPTLFTEAKQSMRIAREEIFGPVLTAIPFDDEADAIKIANDIDYGLAGYIWTNDLGRGLRMANEVDAGMIWVNSENNRHLPTPFGGMKSSGIGRDGGDYSFEFYMETKNICLAYGTHQIPKLGK